MMNAPIIIFAFNRLQPLRNTVASLLKNQEARESTLFVFVDGPRESKTGEVENVAAVMEYVRSISGFKEVHYKFAEKNNGLGPSIINGVSEVINEYGRAIVLEDDLILAPNFLSFMNQGLERYKNAKEVFSICGYSNKVKVPKNYSCDVYFSTRSSSWGWATWADRWNSVDWELRDWQKYVSLKRKFNKWGGSDCFSMLQGWKEGRNKSWAIRFCFAQFLQNKLSLFPIKSKVQNDGFDGAGTNCKRWSRFKYDFDTTGLKVFSWPDKIVLNQYLYSQAMSYNSLPIRIWSRIMYMIYR